MSFMSEVKTEAQRPGSVCTVKVWIDTQPDVTDAEIRKGAAEVTAVAVWRVMNKRGYAHGRQAVERHLRGDCACPTS